MFLYVHGLYDKNHGVYATCKLILPCYPLRHAVHTGGSENDHTGGTRTGPLAAFTEVFRGVDYFHVRRVYRDPAGTWRATGQGITCRVDQRDAMLAALLKVLQASGTLAKPATRGLRKPLLNGGTVEHTTAKL